MSSQPSEFVRQSHSTIPCEKNVVESCSRRKDCCDRLDLLDKEFLRLETSEEVMRHTLDQLKAEEKMIREALGCARESLQNKRLRETKEKEQSAIERLENALLQSSSSSSDDSIDSDDKDSDDSLGRRDLFFDSDE